MAIKTYQAAFVGGEISDRLFGRVDQDIYFKAAQKLENVYVDPQGYVFRREGLEYVDNTPSNAAVRLIPFSFSTEQSYLLEFSAGQFRVFKDDVLQTTVTSAPISGLTADQVQEFDFTQSADTLIITHPDVEPISITRTSDTVWITANLAITNIPPFPFGTVTVSEPAADITPSAATGRDVTVTATASVFSAGDVGQFIRLKIGGLIFIKSFTSGTEVVGDVQVELPGTDPVVSGDWELETGYEDVWSVTRGWPTTVTFFQSRLWFGGSKSRPQTLWGSQSGDFFNFDISEGLDDDAIDVTIDDDRVNAITNMFSSRNLQIFTTGGEFYIQTDIGQPITPTKAELLRSTSHGSNTAKPVSIDGSTIFVESGGSVVREFLFNAVEQSYNATNLSLQASHLISNPTRIAVRQAIDTSPADYVYFVNDTGNVAVLNTLREQALLAWSSFTTPGNSGTDVFEDVAVVEREVYFVVKRTINSVTVRHIEKLNNLNFTDASTRDSDSPAKTSWTGFAQLNGETVKVRGDDFILQDAAVSGGAFTSSEAVENVEAGLNFAATIETLPIQLPIGTSSLFPSDWRRLVFSSVRLRNSRNVIVKVGSKTYKPFFRQFGGEVLDQPIPLFSGWKKVYLQGLDRDVNVTITQEEPLEFEVIALMIGVK